MAGSVAGVAALTVLGAAPASAAANSVLVENQNQGSDGWRLQNPADDDLSQIGAFALEGSVSSGDSLGLCVLVPATTTVTAQVFRLGFYGGLRGRLMLDLGSVDVEGSEPLVTDAVTGETRSAIDPSFSFTVPSDWLSGIYVVRFETAAGVDCHATFTVTDERRAEIVFSQPILTYAAYTYTPQGPGKSLYEGDSGGEFTTSGVQRATVVSLDRPYRTSGSGDLFRWDHDLLTWLEREGYDVTYVTNIDIHEDPATLRRAPVSIVSGHDEYWTQTIMDAYLAARDAGIHIAYLGANGAYWRARLEPALDGRANRRLACWRWLDDPVTATPTVRFKDTETTMQELWGIDFMDYNDFNNGPYAPIVPTEEDHWFWAGTDVENDQPLDDAPIMGYEVDRRNFSTDLPPLTEYHLLGSSPFEGQEFGRNWAHTTLYKAPSGAWVFASGTTSWAWGLMRPGFKHPALHRATRNLLGRMLSEAVVPTDPPASTTVATATSLPGILAADDYTAADADVLRLYRAFFGREPDVSGAKYWLAEARRGRPIQDTAEFFSISPEFVETYGDLDDEGFLTVLYRNVMDRAPDGPGMTYWLAQLALGTRRSRVVLLFADSPEFKAKYPYAPIS